MTYEDVPMFDVDLPEIKTPKRPKATGRPRWSKYSSKSLTKCDDCMLVLVMAKGDAPPARFAHHRRVVDGSDLLLCNAHAQVRRDEDGMKPIKTKETS